MRGLLPCIDVMIYHSSGFHSDIKYYVVYGTYVDDIANNMKSIALRMFSRLKRMTMLHGEPEEKLKMLK